MMLPFPRNQSQFPPPSRREGAAVSQELWNVWKDKCVGIIHTTHCEGRACLVDKTWTLDLQHAITHIHKCT